ncbi:MAG: DUF5597 domain-containing protein, partial [Abitibacteriaceae bacterium]|nr:DUF5597 domain-containing protein [Abditibacteriaceae bacterium]
KAGGYPSGGPVSRIMDVWRAATPAIDFFSPDIYLPDFKGVTASYTRSGNPLFIPEAATGPEAAAKVFYAIGQHDAIGFCPFGIDGLSAEHPLANSYNLLSELLPLIAQHQGQDQMIGLLHDKDKTQKVKLAGYNLEVGFDTEGKPEPAGYGLVIATGPDEFLVAGSGISIHFSAFTPGPRNTRILAIDEGRFKDGRWIPGRRMNGDENAGGWRLQLPAGPPSIQRIQLYRHD